jgi:hypothetical protein
MSAFLPFLSRGFAQCCLISGSSIGAANARLSSCEAGDKPTTYHIRDEGQNRCRDKQLQGVDAGMRDDLIDRVQDERDEENAPDIVPRLSQQLMPAAWIPESGPQEGGLAIPCIVQSSPNREENGHGRFDDQPQSHRPVRTADEILPSAPERLFHNSPSRLGTFELAGIS